MKKMIRSINMICFFLLLFTATTFSTSPGSPNPGWGGGITESGPLVGSGGKTCGEYLTPTIIAFLFIVCCVTMVIAVVLNSAKNTGQKSEPYTPQPDQPPISTTGGEARVNQPNGYSTMAKLNPGSNPIGRGEGNQIQLNDPKVSTRHADLHVSDNQYTLTDLNSRNGTYVNGKRITQTQVYQGDQITVGDSQIIL